MDSHAFRVAALAALTCLSFPNRVAAAGLREEAVSYRTQGYEAQRRGDAGQALTLYQKAAALDPGYPTPHNDTGVLLEEQGRFPEAEQAYQRALMLSPNYLEAHANIAMLYERTGQKEKAIYHWLKRYQLGDPHDPWTARAEERLVALGVLKTYPGLKGKIYTRRRLIGQELQGNVQDLEEFHAVTEEHRGWAPAR
jgi:tetratricopeptide (TPR) repeat protein